MSNPPLEDEVARYEFWKKNLEGYAHMGAMIHAAASLLAMRDAEIARMNSIIESFAVRREDFSYPDYGFQEHIREERVKFTKPLGVYDPEFGDARMCECGHPYSRHFDPYDNAEEEANTGPAGCKYSSSCGCSAGWQDNPCGFVDVSGNQGYLLRTPEGHINNCMLYNEGREADPEHGRCQICNGYCPDGKKLSKTKKA